MEDVSRQLRISVVNLEAIERNDFQALPGQFFTKSFLRQYSQYLGLYDENAEEEIRAIAAMQESPALPGLAPFQAQADLPPVEIAGSQPNGDRYWRLVKPIGVFLLVVAASSAAYVLWERLSVGGLALSEPPPIARTEPASNPPTAKPSYEEQPAAQTQPPATDPARALPEPAAVPPVTHAAAVAPQPPVSLLLLAREEVWVRVVCDGQVVFQGLLNSGETRAFGGSGLARLVIGNAGGLEISFNGRKVGALGSSGQVRVVQFTPTEYEIVPPAPRPLAPGSQQPASPQAQTT